MNRMQKKSFDSKEFAKVVGGRFYVQRSHSQITQILKEFDKDGSGFLERDEVYEV
jgi:hypothetical protein